MNRITAELNRRAGRSGFNYPDNYPDSRTTKDYVTSCRQIASLVMLLFLVVPLNVQAQIATGSFSDSDAEFLQRLAAPVVNVQSATTDSDSSGATRQQRQLLLMEPRILEKDAGDRREADIYIYDYATDEVIHFIIDMVDRALLHSARVRNVQLPLVEDERATALDIAFRNEVNRRQLDAAFLAATGRTLDSIREIKYKAFVFLAASVSEQKAINVRECGLHRCAKLLLYTADNTALDLSPIIDLSSRRVLQITDPQQGG